MTNEKRTPRQPSFIVALIPIVVMIALMLYCFLGGSESGYHDAHMPLVLSIIVACIVGVSGSSTLVQPKTKFFNLATHWKMGFFYETFCQI